VEYLYDRIDGETRIVNEIVPEKSRVGSAVADCVPLGDDERIDWLRLIRSENVGPRGIMAQAAPKF
jgi:hypothetical protein